MKASRLSRVIKIQRKSETLNDARTPVVTWTDFATLRAEKIEQSTSEFMRSSGPVDETRVVFRARYFPGVTNADRIMFGGQAFNLNEIVILGRNRGYEFRCERID